VVFSACAWCSCWSRPRLVSQVWFPSLLSHAARTRNAVLWVLIGPCISRTFSLPTSCVGVVIVTCDICWVAVRVSCVLAADLFWSSVGRRGPAACCRWVGGGTGCRDTCSPTYTANQNASFRPTGVAGCGGSVAVFVRNNVRGYRAIRFPYLRLW